MKLPYIATKHIQSIIDNIHEQYPYIEKGQVVTIVRTFFEVMRDILLTKNSLTIHRFVNHMHLISFKRVKKNKVYNTIMVKLASAKKIRHGK